jgi:hypothetical protein
LLKLSVTVNAAGAAVGFEEMSAHDIVYKNVFGVGRAFLHEVFGAMFPQ